jgi:hypothetical protein
MVRLPSKALGLKGSKILLHFNHKIHLEGGKLVAKFRIQHPPLMVCPFSES